MSLRGGYAVGIKYLRIKLSAATVTRGGLYAVAYAAIVKSLRDKVTNRRPPPPLDTENVGAKYAIALGP